MQHIFCGYSPKFWWDKSSSHKRDMLILHLTLQLQIASIFITCSLIFVHRLLLKFSLTTPGVHLLFKCDNEIWKYWKYGHFTAYVIIFFFISWIILPQTFVKLRQLYCMIGLQSALIINNKLFLYKVMLKPVGTYGIKLWSSVFTSNIKILEKLKSKVLRTIKNGLWFAPYYIKTKLSPE